MTCSLVGFSSLTDAAGRSSVLRRAPGLDERGDGPTAWHDDPLTVRRCCMVGRRRAGEPT